MTSGSLLLYARGTLLESAIDDVQIMPPGRHAITPSGPDGQPVDLTVEVTASTAEALEAARAAYQAEADAGQGDAPYFDFNHEDSAAAAWVKKIYWAGDDATEGGVRAKIEWSASGREAIEGKLFRRFSPAFLVDHATGAITGAPVNMGGLVNRAAFRTIAAFFSKDSQDSQDSQTPTTTPPPTPPTMTEEQIAALVAENESLKQKIEELTATVEAANKTAAENEVEAAAAAGKIAPAEEVKAKWVQSILANPTARELLASLPVNPALGTVIKVQAKTTEAKAESTQPDHLTTYEAMAPSAEKDAYLRAHGPAILAASRARSAK